jgi:hypothetical protein
MPNNLLPIHWTTVRISELLGSEAAGSISAANAQQRAAVDATLKTLKLTNAEFSYAVAEAPLLTVKRAISKQLEDQAISEPSQVSDDAAGMISPHAQLLIQNFTYDRRAAKGRRGGFAGRIVEAVSGSLKIGQDWREHYRFQNPTYAVAAIKPIPFLFAPCGDRNAR